MKIERVEFADEASEALREYLPKKKTYIDLTERWLDEYSERWDSMKTPIADIYEYSKVVENWMRRWEAVWSFSM